MNKTQRIEAQIKAVTGTEIITLETGCVSLVRNGVEIARALPRGPIWAVSIVGGKLLGMVKTEAAAREMLAAL